MIDWATYHQRRLAYLNAKYGPVPDDGPYDEAWFAARRRRVPPRLRHYIPRVYVRRAVKR